MKALQPFHQWNDVSLADARVSAHSLWSDDRWIFDGTTAGQHRSGKTIRWDTELPDGTLLTAPQHRRLLDGWKRVVWAIFAEPGDGQVRKWESLKNIDTGVRYITRWMVGHGVLELRAFTPSVTKDYLQDLARDKATGDEDDDGMDPATLHKYIKPLHYVWWARHALSAAGLGPLEAWPLGTDSVPQVSARLTTKIGGSIPALDDRKFIAIVNTAWEIIEEQADTLIRASNEIADFRITSLWRKRLTRHDKLSHVAGVAESVEAGLTATGLRDRMSDLRTACMIIIQATTGMRVSELVGLKVKAATKDSGLSDIVEIRRTEDDYYEVLSVRGRLFKTTAAGEDTSWVCGVRPSGSDYLPPPVRALQVLDALDEGWRRFSSQDHLCLVFRSGAGFPEDPTNVYEISAGRARERQQQWVKEKCGFTERFTTHMWRKTFAQYMVRTTPGLLPAISRHFKHVTEAMTELGYLKAKTGDQELNDLIRAERYRQAAALMQEIATGEHPVAGPKAKWMRDEAATLMRPQGNRTGEEARKEIEEIVKTNDFKLWDSEFGYCVFAAEGPKCHNLTGPLGAWVRRAPNLAERSPPRCIECPHFAVASEHEPFWRQRLADNRAKWEQVKDDGRTPLGVAAQFRERARQAEIVLTWLDAEKRHAS